jgi:chemotaxis protein MotB
MRLEIVGFGEYHPRQSNDTVEGRNANRRVVVLVLEQAVAGAPPSPDDTVPATAPPSAAAAAPAAAPASAPAPAAASLAAPVAAQTSQSEPRP